MHHTSGDHKGYKENTFYILIKKQTLKHRNMKIGSKNLSHFCRWLLLTCDACTYRLCFFFLYWPIYTLRHTLYSVGSYSESPVLGVDLFIDNIRYTAYRAYLLNY